MVDLSQCHHPVGSLLSLSSEQPFALTSEQVEFFHQNGYVSGVPILSQSQIDLLLEELDRLMRPNHPGRRLWYEFHEDESSDSTTRLFHALGAWRMEAGFHDLLWHSRFLAAASALLDGPVRFWHDQLFCKPARDGGVVAFHQDYSYWTRTEPMAHLTCWIGLDKSTRENGCLHYVPKSHQWELLPATELAGDIAGIRRVLNDEQWKAFQNPVPIELEPGEATFHHPLMLHGSFENRTEGPRRGVVLNVVRDGVRTATDEPLLNGVSAIPKGEALGGQFFPLLTRESV